MSISFNEGAGRVIEAESARLAAALEEAASKFFESNPAANDDDNVALSICINALMILTAQNLAPRPRFIKAYVAMLKKHTRAAREAQQ